MAMDAEVNDIIYHDSRSDLKQHQERKIRTASGLDNIRRYKNYQGYRKTKRNICIMQIY